MEDKKEVEIVNSSTEVARGAFTDMSDDSMQGGLTPKQENYAREIMVRFMKGCYSPSDVNALANMAKYDGYSYIRNMLVSVGTHPDFHADGAGPDNVFKTAMIMLKLIDSQYKNRKTDKETEVMDIKVLNQLRNATYDKPSDGSKFGDHKKTKVIETAPKYEPPDNYIED